ncbi:MAG: glycogen-binding domain-containing protein [Verrucomicrobiota bacterium]
MKTLIAARKFKTPALASSRARGHRKNAKEGSVSGSKANDAAKAVCGGAEEPGVPETKRVSFDWFFPDAKQVFIAGSFNNWRPSATPLRHCGGGRWLLELALRPGRYPFRFFVDGQWADDPGVTSRFLFVN